MRHRLWRGVWRYPDFRRLWLASTVSAFGTDITHTAMPFVAILTLNATPWHLGILKIVTMLPAFFVGLFAGAWLDRVPRRPVMIACDWGRAAVLVTLPVAYWLVDLTFLHLFLAAALLSIASTIFQIADRSMLPTLVDRDELVDANRMLTAGNTVAEASGFAASGWLVQLVSAPGALVVDAATFVWSAVTLRRIDRPESISRHDAPREHLLRDALEGFRFVRGHRVLTALAGSHLLMSIAVQIVGTVYLLYVAEELGFAPGVLGLIFATGGLFSLLASILAGRLMARVGIGSLMIASLVLVASGQGLVALASAATALAVMLLLAQQAMDLPWSLYEITQVSVRQTVTPDAWLGRMNGSFHVLELGGYVIGALAGAWLGNTIGLRGTLVAGAAGTVLAAVPLFLSPVRAMKRIPAAPALPATE